MLQPIDQVKCRRKYTCHTLTTGDGILNCQYEDLHYSINNKHPPPEFLALVPFFIRSKVSY